MRWTDDLREQVRAAWLAGDKLREIRKRFKLTPGQLAGARMRLNLPPRGKGSCPPLKAGQLRAALNNATTVFHDAVRMPQGWVLVPGRDNAKLGDVIAKGPWRGMPIYSLTLEERATCPSNCALWNDCYGNSMPFARRTPSGPELERALRAETRILARMFPQGFTVRLHILGDFYSQAYVAAWDDMLASVPQLHLWGYTAWRPRTPIGDAVMAMMRRHGGRCAMRFSLPMAAPLAAVVSEEPLEGSIACPYESGRTRSCATCALCWSPAARDHAIRFTPHGR